MQLVSKEYKEQIRKPLRNHSFMTVTVGIVNQEAQAGVSADSTKEYAYFAELKKPFDNYDVTIPYAVLEERFTKVDDSMFFMPRENTRYTYINQGIVVKNIGDVIRLVFPAVYDIKGLTIDFSHVYPVDFDIVSNVNTVQIRGNNKQLFVTDEVFNQVTFFEIKPLRMLYGENRLRINRLTMGLGIFFNNTKIISASKKEHISPIMKDLHTLDFDIKINNKDRAFDIENSKSSINFMELGQVVKVTYGYELDSGHIEWVNGCTLNLKSWSADDKTLSLSATDVFDNLNGIYRKGVYSHTGISLYDLAIDVLKDAKVDTRDYYIDSYLKTVFINNPIPAIDHKSALQLIANAGRSLLYQDRAGKICIKSSFLPEMSVSGTDEDYYSKVTGILNGNEKQHYASLADRYSQVEDSVFFLPRNIQGSTYLNTGYISRSISNQDGTFDNNPSVSITMEADLLVFGLRLFFHGYAPKELTFKAYNDGELKDTYKVYNLDLEAVILHEFPLMDRLDIEFNKIQAYNRVVLDKIIFGDVTDYSFEYEKELKKYPVGTLLEKTKVLNTIRTVYQPSTESIKELVKETVARQGKYVFQLSNASYGFVVNQGANILRSSSFEIEIETQSSMEVIISGYEYVVAKQSITKELNVTGKTAKWENPLISSVKHAELISDWVGEYYNSDREYNLTDRGEPRLDAGDLAFLENKYVDGMIIKLEDYTLSFNGALSGSAKARRVMKYGMDRT
jgi:hypothetical protein